MFFFVNKLVLNTNKTSYIVLGIKATSLAIVITLCGSSLERVNVTNFFEVLIDLKVTWRNHMRYVKAKLSKCRADVRFTVPFSLIYPTM